VNLPAAQIAAPPTIAVASITPLLAIMTASGLAPAQVLRRAGLPVDLLESAGETPVRLSDYFRICEQMALQSGDESCHVSLRPLMVGTSELVQARLRDCVTMSGVMDVVANSYNIVHGHRYNLVQRRGQTITYMINDADFPYAFDPHDPFIILSLECLLIYVHVLLLSLAPGIDSLPLRGMRTRGASGADLSHLAFLNVPVRHGADGFALVYDVALDRLPVQPGTSRVLAARTIYGGVADMLDHMAPVVRAEPDIVARVEREICAGRHDQADVAVALGMSIASLRRRLADAGWQFREVRVRILDSLARAALDDGAAIGDVAESLGFSDGRSFARAFRQWNGVAPADYKRTARMSDIVP
jgi:AraC-like DNA-binding protein